MRTCGLLITTLAAAASLAAGAAWAQQVKPGSETGTGLVGTDIPPLLQQVQQDPYKAPAAPACQTVPAEIRELTKVIGPDFNSASVAKEESLTERSAGVARGLIPYGGVVRFVTGADKKDQALREALAAGYARRGFLRGVSMNLNCSAPPPTKPKPRAK